MATMSPDYASQNKGPKIIAVFWAFFSLSIVMVSARLYIRARMLKNIGLDDYIIVAAMVVIASYTIVTTELVTLGYGKHTDIIMEEGGMHLLEQVLLINYINFALGIMSFTIPKLAITALLNRVMNPGPIHRVLLWALTAAVFITSTICIIVLFTMCDPPQSLWKPQLLAEGGICRPQVVLVDYSIFTGALSAFVDLCLALYPTAILISLQMTLKKKLALCAALGLGAIACAMAIVKCNQLPGVYDTKDSTYSTANLVIWTSIESNTIVIASCIPTLGPLYEMIRGKRSWSSRERYYNSNGAKINSSLDRPSKKPIKSIFTHDDLVITNIGTTNEGSQESILGSEELRNGAHPMGSIHRTDQVVVEYEPACRVAPGRQPSL